MSSTSIFASIVVLPYNSCIVFIWTRSSVTLSGFTVLEALRKVCGLFPLFLCPTWLNHGKFLKVPLGSTVVVTPRFGYDILDHYEHTRSLRRVSARRGGSRLYCLELQIIYLSICTNQTAPDKNHALSYILYTYSALKF